MRAASSSSLGVARGYPKNGFARAKAQDRQVTGQDASSRAKARDLGKISPIGRNDNALRPLRLCGRYSEFWLRLRCARIYVICHKAGEWEIKYESI